MTTHTDFSVGDRVTVSNGGKRPPDRFNRKLAAWKNENYSGHVHEIEEPRSYSPYGSVILKRDDYPDNSVITFKFHVPLGGRMVVSHA